MNFFEQQEKAHTNTSKLVLLFCLAVLGFILLTSLVVGFGIIYLDEDNGVQLFSWRNFGIISLGVCGTVFCAVVFKWLQLLSGGKAVAESLGGRRISPNTDDFDKKRVLNVVEEMALAAGMPVPPVYLLEYENSINAFAAGHTPANAVIGITQGSIDNFTREELQGVIGHEFSHILNGDMRLNMRLIALLNGILFVGHIGRFILYSDSSSRNKDSGGAGLVIAGLAFIAIGFLGNVVGNLIKAAISRQREYLADASAVQFTRNSNGIANALKRIGGYKAGTGIMNTSCNETSHMFFGQALNFSEIMATHPALGDRIRQIEPDWDGNFIYPAKVEDNVEESREQKKERIAKMIMTDAAVLSGVNIDKQLEQRTQLLNAAMDGIDSSESIVETSIPAKLESQARDALGATALCCALLLSKDENIKNKQIQIINDSYIKGLSELTLNLVADINLLVQEHRIQLIGLLVPALKCMSDEQYQQFKVMLMALIHADQKMELFEWCIFQLVSHYVAGEFESEEKAIFRYEKPEKISESCQIVLSTFAYCGHTDEKNIQRAFTKGANSLGLYTLSILEQPLIDIDDFIKSIDVWKAASPMLKYRLLNSLEKCITCDEVITAEERELITTVAAVINTPLPKLSI